MNIFGIHCVSRTKMLPVSAVVKLLERGEVNLASMGNQIGTELVACTTRKGSVVHNLSVAEKEYRKTVQEATKKRDMARRESSTAMVAVNREETELTGLAETVRILRGK